MYTSVVGGFLNSIQALRLYVNSVETRIMEKNELLEDNSIVAMLMHMAKEMKLHNANFDDISFPEEFPEEFAQQIRDSLGLFSEMVEISEDGKTGRYRSIPKPVKESYIKVEALQRQNEILYSGSLMLLVTYFENTIAKILKKDLQIHPQRMSLETKSVSYKILEMSNNIEDVRNFLIENEVTAMMYKSVSEWIEYFKKSVKLKLEYVTKTLPELKEIISRRNVIVHNEGVVNNIYMNTVSEEYRLHVHIGDILSVDREYILNAIDLVELIGMSIILEMWINESDKDKKEVDKVLAIVFDEYLIFEKWENARILYEICLKSNKMQLADELMCKINRWQCYKWLGQFDEMKREVEELDITACQPMYKLGVLALLEKDEEFFECFGKQNDIGESELKEWPLFRGIRQNQIYIQRYGISEG